MHVLSMMLRLHCKNVKTMRILFLASPHPYPRNHRQPSCPSRGAYNRADHGELTTERPPVRELLPEPEELGLEERR